jgi:hypothetical protein
VSQSISHYVSVSVALEGNGTVPASFGVPALVVEHALEADRVSSLFTSAADVITAGHASGSPAHEFATMIAAQQPRVAGFRIIRRDSGDADIGECLDEAYAEEPAAWYCTMEETRDATEIEGLAEWTEAIGNKIALAQSNDASLLTGTGPEYSAVVEGTATDGTYILTFTGFGLVSPVAVSTTRAAGTPATNALIGDALRAELVTAATGPGGSLFGEVVLASIGGTGATITWRMTDGLNSGTVVSSGTAVAGAGDLTVTTTDADIGSALFALQYTRTALMYHPTDAEFLDGAWASRCLSANLDQRKLAWAMKRLNGIEGTNLDNAQIEALRAINVNYFAPAVMSSGDAVQAFTAQGWVSSGEAAAGRRIDTTITLDWARARFEEAFANVLLREPNSIVYDNPGINRFAAAARSVIGTGLAARHFVEFVVPEGEDREFLQTPAIFVPKLSQTTTTQRAARTLTGFSALAYLAESIEKVEFAFTARR